MTDKSKKKDFKTSIGGQALIEGIMMRGPDKVAIVVRGPEGLVSKEEEMRPAKERFPVLGLPVIRGVYGFFESMKIGIGALTYSTEFFPEDESSSPSKFELFIERRFKPETIEKVAMGIALVFGITLPILLFILLPTLLAGLLDGVIGSGILRNLLEGALRIGIFLLYLTLVSKLKDMRRVFAYHGAEHKTVHCYEAGEELTVENVRRHTRLHPRCGTSFLFVVMIISILVFSFVRWSNPLIRVALRLVLLPLVVGLSYELNRFAGRHDNAFTRFLRAPGMWLQNLTTNEPDDSMIEVGIEALSRVIPRDAGSDAW